MGSTAKQLAKNKTVHSKDNNQIKKYISMFFLSVDFDVWLNVVIALTPPRLVSKVNFTGHVANKIEINITFMITYLYALRRNKTC